MKIEDQVCSLEYARRLKELGVKQKSLFYWKEFQDRWYLDYCDKPLEEFNDRWCSAFTVAELGEMLPQLITQNGKCYRLDIFKETICWFVAYVESDREPPFIIYMNMKEVNSRAQMLIYLFENKLISL